MYKAGNLIPARFLALIAHLSICITLLWGSERSIRTCLPEEMWQTAFQAQHTQLVVGLSLSLALICFELFTFLFGITMFHPTSALFSTGCHGVACITLTYFLMDSWQCGWHWWIFSFCNALPAFYDLCIMCSVFIGQKY